MGAPNQHLMFDIDGTLVESCEFDGQCYDEAVYKVTGDTLIADRTYYSDVSDEGILRQHFIEKQTSGVEAKLLTKEIKKIFIEKIKHHLQHSPAVATPGALSFFSYLRQHPMVTISMATGGWRDTALLKLSSAGFQTSDLLLASSDNHYARTQIMQHARQLADGDSRMPVTYFGDGKWDKTASHQLGWNFVLVGSATTHQQTILDFNDRKKILDYLPVTVN